jgi:His/Glu/Gln/Arg/opine family amino acid ABC transporter permease subunit
MFDFQAVWPSIPYIFDGLLVTLFYTGTSVVGGMIIGIFLTGCKLSSARFFTFFADAYTSVFRGTPLILQLGMIYYASQGVTGYPLAVWQAGILAFSLNSGAYLSEIMRAGVQSIDKGQKEAALCLGIPPFLIFKDIIFPQAVRIILPALVNEMVDLLKESALVSTITETDLMRRAMIVAAEKILYFEPFLIVGGIYYVLVMMLTFFSRYLEKRLRLS